jgi:hypothetical protein
MKRSVLIAAALAGSLLLGVASTSQADIFTYTGSVVDYTVPTTGTFDFSASGAQGGVGGGTGGLGAVISGDISLTAGTMLEIVAGGQGSTGLYYPNSPFAGGGGGGSFVFVSGAPLPLIVAGGGGGGSAAGATGGPGQTGQDGGVGGYSGGGGAGGTGGSGGSAGPVSPYSFAGAGGGGWAGDGGNYFGAYYVSNAPGGGFGPPTFAGGVGDGSYEFSNGGFGGGGGGGEGGGGGGGGYSGGGGGNGNDGTGGGGGSYLNPSFTNTELIGGANSGNGIVAISLVSAAVPEPSSVVLFLLGALGLAGRAWRHR